MRTSSHRILILALGFIFSTFVQGWARSAQPPTDKQPGAVKGVIVDIQDARVVGAAIVITNKRFQKELKSDDAGEFEIHLPTGKYTITVDAHGFTRYKGKTIRVKPNETLNIKIELQVAHSS